MHPSESHPAADFREYNLEAALAPYGVGSITVLDSVASTNIWLAERVAAQSVAACQELSGGGLEVVVAGHQHGGRGRLDRSWDTPAGQALTFSVAWAPQRSDGTMLSPQYWPWLTLIMAQCVTQALRECAGVPAVIKWPNDVLVNELKICGVLATVVGSGSEAVLVVGAGLNVHQQTLPVATATSIAREMTNPGQLISRPQLLSAILARYSQRLQLLADDPQKALGPHGGLRLALQRDLDTVGRTVNLYLPHESEPGSHPVQAQATGLGPSGELLATTHDGTPLTLSAGEVVHVRAADQGSLTPAVRRAQEQLRDAYPTPNSADSATAPLTEGDF